MYRAITLLVAIACFGVFATNRIIEPQLVRAQVPPAQGDHTFRITHIEFDHLGPNKNTSDGLNIRRDVVDDLQHEGNGVGDGEWVRNSRNEEALLVANKAVTIKVRIECDNCLKSAKFWATEKLPPPPLPPLPAQWLNVNEKPVSFVEEIPGALWVSWNITPGVADPEYVEFVLSANTKLEVDKAECVWQWKVKDIDCSAPSDPPDPNPQPYDIEESRPHTFYVVLDVPFGPWYVDPVAHPWVTALGFVIETHLLTSGETSLPSATGSITKRIWEWGWPSYDHDQGPPSFFSHRYVPPNEPRKLSSPLPVIRGEPDSEYALSFQMTDYIAQAFPEGECHDFAAAVQTCGNLLGAKGRFYAYSTFVYIQPHEFADSAPPTGIVINNPFFRRNADPTDPFKVNWFPFPGDDLLNEDVNPADGFMDRSYFTKHTYVLMGGSSGVVYDATMGPYTGAAAHAAYLLAAIDTSTRPESFGAAQGRTQYFCSIRRLR